MVSCQLEASRLSKQEDAPRHSNAGGNFVLSRPPQPSRSASSPHPANNHGHRIPKSHAACRFPWASSDRLTIAAYGPKEKKGRKNLRTSTRTHMHRNTDSHCSHSANGHEYGNECVRRERGSEGRSKSLRAGRWGGFETLSVKKSLQLTRHRHHIIHHCVSTYRDPLVA